MSQQAQRVSDNITVTARGDTLTVTIKLGEGEPSGSGKSLVFASTRGNQPISTPKGVMRLGLNLYQPNG